MQQDRQIEKQKYNRERVKDGRDSIICTFSSQLVGAPEEKDTFEAASKEEVNKVSEQPAPPLG